MSWLQQASVKSAADGFLRSLLRDRSGNALAIVAAAIVPLLAMIGGGIDMGRSYLTESRLQAACDAGVLAARKKLGSGVVLSGVIPANIGTAAQSYFNINFPSGVYGTENRTFVPTLESNYAISGVATADVPTTIMRLFSFTKVPVRVECEAMLNFSNTDLMMVLDTTGSMLETVSYKGSTVTRISALKSVVHDFYMQVNGNKGPGTRIRYGFVPYSNNVNVGGLLADDWVATTWNYESRVQVADHAEIRHDIYDTNWTSVPNSSGVEGTFSDTEYSRYAATWVAPSGESGTGYYSCPIDPPANDYDTTTELVVDRTEDPVGSGNYVTKYKWTGSKTEYWMALWGTDCVTRLYEWQDYAETYDTIDETYTHMIPAWDYKPISTTFTNWRTQTAGCIEERKTSKLHNFSDFSAINVNTDYLDLNIDMVPVAGNINTQWKPAYPDAIYLRGIDHYGYGTPSPAPILDSTYGSYMHPKTSSYAVGLTACPSPAMKLTEINDISAVNDNVGEIDAYLNTLAARGATYHDIGMIWGARLMSKDGLFAAENADQSGKPTSRHIIFMTDGATMTSDLVYSAYGIEGLDNRRVPTGMDITQTVEKRFSFTCEEVKKKNIVVWVIGFGTTVSTMLQNCATDDLHWFQANDADALSEAFSKIAVSLGELRISK